MSQPLIPVAYLVSLLIGCLAYPVTAAESAATDEGFRPLFNGKDLTGWKADEQAKQHWRVADGIIKYDGKSRDLWTEQ